MSVQESFKPRDVDELLDFYVYRRLAAPVVAVLAATGVSPNQVTVAAGVIGGLSGVAVAAAATGPTWWLAIGVVLLLSSMVLDCCDGQLARIRGETSMFGRCLDGISDTAPTLSMFVGLAVFMDTRFGLGWTGWLVGVVAGASTIWQTYLYDAAKNVYLSNTKAPEPNGGSGLVTVEAIRKELAEARADKRWAHVVVLTIFLSHASGQHKAFGRGPQPTDRAITVTPRERNAYRALHKLPMRLWSFLGLATHLTLLAGGALAAAHDPTALLWIWGIFIIPMNLLLFWLRGTEQRRTELALGQIAQLRTPAGQQH